MRCPFCRTENRNERDACYYCEKDLSMLKLIVTKARSHFNTALELAERDRNEEAIAELHNALDLDRSHVNCHVVLGTLYAKIGDLEKAGQCWEEALLLDPRLLKAHEYLQKADTAARTFPICIRQRKIIVALSLLAGVLAILFSFSLVHVPDRLSIENAWNAYENKRYAEALGILDEVAPKTLEGRQAAVLREVIVREQNLQIRSAQQFVRQGDILQADRMLQNLLDHAPSTSAGQRAKQLRNSLVQRARASVTQALEDYRNRLVAADTVQKEIRDYRLLSRTSQNDAFLLQSEAALTSITQTLEIEDVVVLFERQEIDKWQLLEKLVELRGEYPDSAMLAARIDEFSSPMENELIHKIAAALEAEKLAETVLPLRELERLYAILAPESAAGPIIWLDPLPDRIGAPALFNRIKMLADTYCSESLLKVGLAFRERLEEKLIVKIEGALNADRLSQAKSAIIQYERLRAAIAPGETNGNLNIYKTQLEDKENIALEQEARAAYEAENDEEAITLGEKLLKSERLDQDRRIFIETLVARANERLAQKRWVWIVERDRRYLDGTISLIDAETTVKIYPQVAEHLSPKIYPAVQDNLLLYLALSYRQVGQKAKAMEALEKIEKEYPNSDIMHWVKIFKEQDKNPPE